MKKPTMEARARQQQRMLREGKRHLNCSGWEVEKPEATLNENDTSLHAACTLFIINEKSAIASSSSSGNDNMYSKLERSRASRSALTAFIAAQPTTMPAKSR